MTKTKSVILVLVILLCFSISCSYAAITEQQGEDVAAFATKFIEEGNARRDDKGFPLLTYALTGSWNNNVKLRTAGYNGQMTYIKNNGYYISGGRYLELGNKWAMDCGTTVLFLLKNTLGLELLTSDGEPWHVIDIYRDACKGENSEIFEFVYRDIAVGRIDYSKLQKGDVIGYYTSHGNHGMLYLGDGYIAHANRDMIRSWGNDKISGFQVNKLNGYFLSGTHVRVYRIKDGIIPEELVVNGFVTWPDTGETVDLLEREPVVEEIIEEVVEEVQEITPSEELVEATAKKELYDRLNTMIQTKEFVDLSISKMAFEKFVKLQETKTT